MAVAANADVYAGQRINIFFPGVIPELDGQCVSLAKWFMQEMSSVPNPQAARGDARYVGKTLVAQGHAVEVPYAQRRRGDLICYEYGTYGHIGVVLSGDRTFEENVNWAGVASKVVDGATVYASRIGNLGEAWRHDQHIYRLNSYNEGGSSMDGLLSKEDVIAIYGLAFDNPDSEANQEVITAFTGKYYRDLVNYLRSDPSWQAHAKAVQNPPSGGNIGAGTYLKVDKANVIEVK